MFLILSKPCRLFKNSVYEINRCREKHLSQHFSADLIQARIYHEYDSIGAVGLILKERR